ncbi:MAG: acylneuraminate cytidylyltransferase family protein [Verrucomicrobiales bacterium]|nr:acylneuraminate cytidylyltransferase family protein [Verrucomicrobiales bacterium]
MNVLAVIPARGGSKGIPKKNLIDFCGHPLLAWSIAAARRCSRIDQVCVSTDCPAIERTALAYGAAVVQRPPELATDRCRSESALIHACEEAARRWNARPEVVVMLQATSPLREAGELQGALEIFEERALDSLFAAARPEDFLLWQDDGKRLWSLNYDHTNRKPRQETEAEATTLWVETGSFYVTRTNLLLQTQNRLGGRIGVWEVPLWKSFEIDSYTGLELCASLMRHYGVDRLTPEEFFREIR